MGIKFLRISFQIIFSIIFLTNCSTSNLYKLKTVEYDVKLLIRGPGTCIHMILINRNGKGKIIRGRTMNSPAKEFKSFNDIEYLSYFQIKPEDDLKKINKNINLISNSSSELASYRLDARRKELYVDKIKKADIYGLKGQRLMQFLKDLTPFLPYNINSFCETSSGILVKSR